MNRDSARHLYEHWSAEVLREGGTPRPWDTLTEAERVAWAQLVSAQRGFADELRVKVTAVRVWLRHGQRDSYGPFVTVPDPGRELERMQERLDVVIGALQRFGGWQ